MVRSHSNTFLSVITCVSHEVNQLPWLGYTRHMEIFVNVIYLHNSYDEGNWIGLYYLRTPVAEIDLSDVWPSSL
jgi:hypothetical protein